MKLFFFFNTQKSGVTDRPACSVPMANTKTTAGLYRKLFFYFLLVLKSSKLHPNSPAGNKQIDEEKQFWCNINIRV